MAFEFDGVLIDPAKFYSYFNDVDLKQIYVDDVLVWTRIDAPVITRQPVNAPDVVQNQDYTFSLEASSGDGTNHYQWYNSATVGDESNPVGTDSPSFTNNTPNVGAHYYWCKVWNERGSVNSRLVSVYVDWDASLPVFTSQPQTVNLYQAGTATFSVAVNWNKNVGTLQWYKNGVPVGSNSTTYSFNAGNGDHGSEIKCVATNVIGSVTSALAHVYIEYLGEIVIDNSQNVNLPDACTRIEYQMVAAGGGGAGGHCVYTQDAQWAVGSGAGGAGQYKEGSLTVTHRNLFVVIGQGGKKGRGGKASGNPSDHGENGSRGGNTDIRVGSSSGTVLVWCNGGGHGLVGVFGDGDNGPSGDGGNDGDGNKGGKGVRFQDAKYNDGNNGNGRAGGSGSNYNNGAGSSRGGNGGQAGENGGGKHDGDGLAGCGGGGGKSAAPWGGEPGYGGAAWQKAQNYNILIRNASSATGYGHGGGGGCKSAQWNETIAANAGNGGDGAPGRCIIKMFTK